MVDFIVGLVLGCSAGMLFTCVLAGCLFGAGGQVPPKANPSAPPECPAPAVGGAARVRRYSAAWQRAQAHGVGRPVPEEGVAAAVSVETETGVHRFLLDEHATLFILFGLIESLWDYRRAYGFQSDSSSGSPSVDVSVPQEGEKV